MKEGLDADERGFNGFMRILKIIFIISQFPP